MSDLIKHATVEVQKKSNTYKTIILPNGNVSAQ